MANKTIIQLSDLVSAASNAVVPIDTGIQTFKITLANLAASMTALLTPLLKALPPVGAIMPYIPGYFANGSNGTLTIVGPSANTEAALNTYFTSNDMPWRVCNGAAPNDAASPLYNTAAKYMPNLSDQRFLRGNTTAGSIGGVDSITLTTTQLPAHTHTAGSYATSLGIAGSAPSLTGTTSFATAGHAHTPGTYLAHITSNSSGGMFLERVAGGAWSATHQSGTVAGGGGGGAQSTGSLVEGTSAAANASGSVGITNGSYSLTGSNIVTGTSGSTGTGTAFSIIPKFLDCFYIQRIK